MRLIINHLYYILVQATDFPTQNTASTLRSELLIVLRALISFSRCSQQLDLTVPTDVIAYVEAGRNPDIYTREFVEAAQKLNQERKGRSESYAVFRDALAKEIKEGVPDLRAEVDGVLARTGG